MVIEGEIEVDEGCGCKYKDFPPCLQVRHVKGLNQLQQDDMILVEPSKIKEAGYSHF